MNKSNTRARKVHICGSGLATKLQSATVVKRKKPKQAKPPHVPKHDIKPQFNAFDLLGGTESRIFTTAVDDPTDALEPSNYQTPEQRLVDAIVSMAIREAEQNIPKRIPVSEQREMLQDKADARAWLRYGEVRRWNHVWGRAGAAQRFNARECFEHLGMDYEAALKALEKRWKGKK